jgi:diguanylate cyclase (GGDEF)-like protein/PAS domain S-box-containing protein
MVTRRSVRGKAESVAPPEIVLPDPEQLRLLMDALPDAIYFKDTSSRFLRVSRALARRLGLSDPAEAVGRCDADFFTPEHADRAVRDEQEIMRSGVPVVDVVEQETWTDGRVTWVSTTKMPLRDASGRIVGTFGLSRDVTAHKQAEEALRNSMALYHSLVQNLPQNIFRKDLDGRFTFANQKFCRTLGRRLEDVLGRTDADLFPVEQAEKYRRDDREVVRSGRSFETVEEHVGPNHELRYVQVLKSPVYDSRGKTIGIQGLFWDVTELHTARQALERSEERYKLALEGARDGLWDWDLRSQALHVAARWKAMLGYEDPEIAEDPEEWLKRVHPEDLPKLRAALDAHVAGTSDHFECEHRVFHKDGQPRWMLARGIGVRGRGGRAVRLAGSMTDVTERHRYEEQLARQAFYDSLTGLPNRSLFMDRLGQAVTRSRRRKRSSFCVFFLDVDRFKDVNDSLGHVKGDQLLTGIARRLEVCVRPGDTVARLGGDEFTILLDDLRDPSDAIQVADRILKEMAKPLTLEGQEVFATVSIGIAPGKDYENAADLIRDADTAMYRAKERGRSCYEIFDTAMHSRAVLRLQLETDLRKALEREEFRVYYQPIVSLSGDRLAGFEALVRWQHPQRGLVPPGEFLPQAEETGLIVPIDLWVLRAACRRMHAWKRSHPQAADLRINVNLSTKHFAIPGLVDRVGEALAGSGLDGSFLTLEITESAIMEETKLLADLFSRLKDLKVRLYLDDFGTGYSSLAYLHRFPIDSLKIHQSFVGQLGKEGGQGHLVRTITTLARNMAMGVVAEGVETSEQLDLLRGLRCDRVQGYYFAKPLSETEADELIRKGIGAKSVAPPRAV